MLPREVEFVLKLTSMQGSEVYCVLTVRGAIEEVNIFFLLHIVLMFGFFTGRKHVRHTSSRQIM